MARFSLISGIICYYEVTYYLPLFRLLWLAKLRLRRWPTPPRTCAKAWWPSSRSGLPSLPETAFPSDLSQTSLPSFKSLLIT